MDTCTCSILFRIPARAYPAEPTGAEDVWNEQRRRGIAEGAPPILTLVAFLAPQAPLLSGSVARLIASGFDSHECILYAPFVSPFLYPVGAVEMM